MGTRRAWHGGNPESLGDSRRARASVSLTIRCCIWHATGSRLGLGWNDYGREDMSGRSETSRAGISVSAALKRGRPICKIVRATDHEAGTATGARYALTYGTAGASLVRTSRAPHRTRPNRTGFPLGRQADIELFCSRRGAVARIANSYLALEVEARIAQERLTIAAVLSMLTSWMTSSS